MATDCVISIIIYLIYYNNGFGNKIRELCIGKTA